jgi:hypothetical protein
LILEGIELLPPAHRALLSPVKYWEIIADNLKKAGLSYGYVSAVDSCGRTIFVADAHRDGKRFVVRAGEKLTAFVELESAIRGFQRIVLTSWRNFLQSWRR